jgi:hypothetical protein
VTALTTDARTRVARDTMTRFAHAGRYLALGVVSVLVAFVGSLPAGLSAVGTRQAIRRPARSQSRFTIQRRQRLLRSATSWQRRQPPPERLWYLRRLLQRMSSMALELPRAFPRQGPRSRLGQQLSRAVPVTLQAIRPPEYSTSLSAIRRHLR